LEPQVIDLALDLAADFIDLFEARGWAPQERGAPSVDAGSDAVTITHRASDGVEQSVSVTYTGVAEVSSAMATGGGIAFSVALAPGEVRPIRVAVSLSNPLDRPPTRPFDYESWRTSFDRLFSSDVAIGAHGPSLARAVDDTRGLLLFTPEGPVPAAGIPWFVAAFGRDALLTAWFLLPYRPDVAAGTLRYLARWQATEVDRAREAEPGKIMHELRFGELTRTGKTPHSPYYGSVDATLLFVMLLDAYVQVTDDDTLVHELRPAWEAALAWAVGRGDADGDGFIEFGSDAAGTGHLSVQSWKDSHDSMSHATGELATGPLAVSEVQGYAYAAYAAAARWYSRLHEQRRATDWSQRAERLRDAFDAAFWLEDLGTYAMALDGDKRPLAVLNSDAGQLLWTGIVVEDRAPRLVATLMSGRSWSGWGLRTLGVGEARYNPVSYHNGSVWPHDTALFGAGLARYGYADQSAAVREALFDLASCQPDLRLPELVAGYARDGRPPVPYPVACRPQAWDAAALVYLASLEP
ncbi:MAG TPA: amylo-alpha-1,6-glucosidase, partial [Trueperaceae bacterium]|nr:amylo-alpha-1,6-glucosidase [Trueperaceae bacterium]